MIGGAIFISTYCSNIYLHGSYFSQNTVSVVGYYFLLKKQNIQYPKNGAALVAQLYNINLTLVKLVFDNNSAAVVRKR